MIPHIKFSLENDRDLIFSKLNMVNELELKRGGFYRTCGINNIYIEVTKQGKDCIKVESITPAFWLIGQVVWLINRNKLQSNSFDMINKITQISSDNNIQVASIDLIDWKPGFIKTGLIILCFMLVGSGIITFFVIH